jgi:hypothetical protein
MNAIQKSLAALAVTAFGIALAPSAGARSTVAWAGASNPLTAGNCFSESFGRVTNTGCNSQQTWEVALPVEASGAWTVTVNVTPTADPSSVHCMSFAVDENATHFTSSPAIFASEASIPQNIVLTGASVPGGGALYVGCFLTQGAAVNTINWNQ